MTEEQLITNQHFLSNLQKLKIRQFNGRKMQKELSNLGQSVQSSFDNLSTRVRLNAKNDQPQTFRIFLYSSVKHLFEAEKIESFLHYFTYIMFW